MSPCTSKMGGLSLFTIFSRFRNFYNTWFMAFASANFPPNCLHNKWILPLRHANQILEWRQEFRNRIIFPEVPAICSLFSFVLALKKKITTISNWYIIFLRDSSHTLFSSVMSAYCVDKASQFKNFSNFPEFVFTRCLH